MQLCIYYVFIFVSEDILCIQLEQDNDIYNGVQCSFFTRKEALEVLAN